MIYDFIYYNTIGFSLSLLSFYTLEFISHPRDFKKRLYYHKDIVCYWVVDKVVSIKLLYDEYVMDKVENIYRKIRTPYEEEITDFIYKEGQKEVVFKKYIIDDDYYYSQRENIEDIVQPFMSIELHYNNRVYDIAKHMRHFCVVGNTFDYNFFMNLLYTFYNEKKQHLLNPTMNVHIVDTNCDIAEISLNNHKITITRDGYNIK